MGLLLDDKSNRDYLVENSHGPTEMGILWVGNAVAKGRMIVFHLMSVLVFCHVSAWSYVKWRMYQNFWNCLPTEFKRPVSGPQTQNLDIGKIVGWTVQSGLLYILRWFKGRVGVGLRFKWHGWCESRSICKYWAIRTTHYIPLKVSEISCGCMPQEWIKSGNILWSSEW